MVVLDAIVRDNGTGIGVVADASAVLDRVRSEHSQFDGMYFQAVSTEAPTMITDSTFAFNGHIGVNVYAIANARTLPQVERSVLADDGAAGMQAGGDVNADVIVALTRSAIHRNTGAGVAVTPSGDAVATVSENAFSPRRKPHQRRWH